MLFPLLFPLITTLFAPQFILQRYHFFMKSQHFGLFLMKTEGIKALFRQKTLCFEYCARCYFAVPLQRNSINR